LSRLFPKRDGFFMVNLNGTLSANTDSALSTANRGLNYGDAVFETLRVSGGKILFWEDHYFRLMASMRMLRMDIPMNFTPEFLEEEVLKTVTSSEEKNAAFGVKIITWRVEGGKYTPIANGVEYQITYDVLEHPFYILNEDLYEIELFKDHYVHSGLLSTIKTNNKIINVLGSIYAKENDYANCLLLNERKQVVEALNGNMFLVNGTTIKTPPLEDGCLKGILRKQLLDILKEFPKYTVEEASISPFELQKADELFVTNVIRGIQSVTKYRKKEYTTNVAKELLPRLNIKARLG